MAVGLLREVIRSPHILSPRLHTSIHPVIPECERVECQRHHLRLQISMSRNSDLLANLLKCKISINNTLKLPRDRLIVTFRMSIHRFRRVFIGLRIRIIQRIIRRWGISLLPSQVHFLRIVRQIQDNRRLRFPFRRGSLFRVRG
jgi:hypothetical protein